jgi:hypothetical protein
VRDIVSKQVPLDEQTVRTGIDLTREQVAKRLRCFERLLVGRHGRMRLHDENLDHFSRIAFPIACRFSPSRLHVTLLTERTHATPPHIADTDYAGPWWCGGPRMGGGAQPSRASG